MINEQLMQGITGNTLVINVDNDLNVGYDSRMISENKIQGFVNTSIRNIDGNMQYIYDVTSKSSLQNVYEHMLLGYEDIYSLVNGIVYAIEAAMEYLLCEDNIIFDAKHIFVDLDTKKMHFCYYPGYNKSIKDSLISLAEYILQKTDHTDERGTKLAYDMYMQVFNGDFLLKKLITVNELTCEVKDDTDTVCMENIEADYIEEREAPRIPVSGLAIILSGGLVELIIISMLLISLVYNSEFLSELLSLAEMKVMLAVAGAVSVIIPTIILIRWFNERREYVRNSKAVITEEYSYSSGDYIGDTCRINTDSKCPRLVSSDNGRVRELILDVFPYIIGKKESVCNGVIDSEGISRMHAKIVNEAGDYYLYDMFSTNGTCVNGVSITNGEGIRLNVNDEISFAGDIFYFR